MEPFPITNVLFGSEYVDICEKFRTLNFFNDATECSGVTQRATDTVTRYENFWPSKQPKPEKPITASNIRVDPALAVGFNLNLKKAAPRSSKQNVRSGARRSQGRRAACHAASDACISRDKVRGSCVSSEPSVNFVIGEPPSTEEPTPGTAGPWGKVRSARDARPEVPDASSVIRQDTIYTVGYNDDFTEVIYRNSNLSANSSFQRPEAKRITFHGGGDSTPHPNPSLRRNTIHGNSVPPNFVAGLGLDTTGFEKQGPKRRSRRRGNKNP